MMDTLFDRSIDLLRQLIGAPSFSKEEDRAADIWEEWLRARGVKGVTRHCNNVYALTPNYKPGLPVLMLNSHLDTVRPASAYTRDPFSPEIADGKLYGLGSNDAGASGVSLAAAFIRMSERKDLPFNLLLAISAAEEVMGPDGMRSLLPHLKSQGLYPDMAIIGEPTGMHPAIAERGLVVIDGVTSGVAGHAARKEGVNALYRAIEDITLLRDFKFSKESEVLGPIGVNVTMIQAGTQHNAVPDRCSFVVDVRTTDVLTNEQTVDALQKAVKWSELTPRSTRIRASVIGCDHPLVKAAVELGRTPYVSPTTSDMAAMPDVDSLKIGPGDSARSHSADEFIYLSEIQEAIHLYPLLIEKTANYVSAIME